MARPKRAQTTAEQIEQAENQEALLKAVAASKWSYEKIMEFIQSDPTDAED